MTDNAVQHIVSREGLRAESPDSVNVPFVGRNWSVTIYNVDEKSAELLRDMQRRYDDLIRQGLANNLWDSNPGELERWADDGGAVW